MNTFLKTLIAVVGFYWLAINLAFADMAVSFDEGAPKDRFTFSNTGDCTIEAATLKLDLAGSKSGLIFDVTASGAGVEVFQPLEITSGQNAIVTIPDVSDGDNQIVFEISQLKSGQSLSFTIDVDDTMGGREITVSGSEISGAEVSFIQAGVSESSAFGSNAATTIKLSKCKLL